MDIRTYIFLQFYSLQLGLVSHRKKMTCPPDILDKTVKTLDRGESGLITVFFLPVS